MLMYTEDLIFTIIVLSGFINIILFLMITTSFIYKKYFKSQMKYFLVGFLVNKKNKYECIMINFENENYLSYKMIKKMIKNKYKEFKDNEIGIISYTELNKEACYNFI